MYDHLTNLPQEKYLIDRYDLYIKDKCSYMIAVDFAKLKYINDNFGHSEGDNSLKLFADLTSRYFSDSLVSRLHGDEFCILTKVDSEELKKRLEMIQNDINIQHEKNNIKFPFSFNCGIKRCEPDYNLTKEKADYAMYSAKRANELYIDFSEEDFCNKIEEEAFIKNTDKMLKNPKNQFSFHYQIIKDNQNYKDQLMEIYVRDKNGGVLFDYDKYRILRKNHRMKYFDLCFLEELFNNYHNYNFKDLDVIIKVNYRTLVALEFDFAKIIRDLVENNNINPDRIVLMINILEFDSDYLLICNQLQKLKDIGFRLGLDDLNINSIQTVMRIMYEVDIDYVKIRHITLFKGMNNKKAAILLDNFVNTISQLGALPIFSKIEVVELLDYVKTLSPKYLVKGSYVSKEQVLEKNN